MTVAHIKDGAEDYVRLDFKDRNYSLELDGENRLMSCMLWGYAGFSEQTKGLPNMDELKEALRREDPSVLAEVFAPDSEIYLKGDVLKLAKASSLEFKESKAWRSALFGDGGLRVALNRKDAVEDFQLRITDGAEEGHRVLSVCKFPKSPTLQEIVFAFHAGRWRVYEVAFRSPKAN